MKKAAICLVCMLVMFTIGGCGSKTSSTTCKLKKDVKQSTVVIYYDDDSEIISYKDTATQKISKATTKYISDGEVSKYIVNNLTSLETEGVTIDAKYNKKTRIAKTIIKVTVDNLKKSNYSHYGIDKNLKVSKTIKYFEDSGYKCK